jgi:hypothetical protein
MNIRYGLGAVLALLVFGQAHAGSVTNGTWTPSGCGAEPQPPTIDLATADSFNKSLDADEKYSNDSKKYIECAFKEATADGQAINAAETAMQSRRSTAEDKNKTDIDAGMAKYAGGDKKKK